VRYSHPSCAPPPGTRTECGRALADVATTRRRRGLPQRPANSATCSDRCERAREERLRLEAAARGVRLERGEWRCYECGCTAAEAIAKDEGPMTARSRVCSPRCAGQRKSRTVAAIMRETQRTPRSRLLRTLARQRPGLASLPASWRCSECGADQKEARRARRCRGQRGLPANAATCGAQRCQRERERRRFRELRSKGG
jgi:hypothetical protein